ncbi:hypothetical protein [Deminuibacter soli]|uniref:Uncharacterized protein n=1 Tax=Deminuibacter soli TaxID=2291815 RepID=A0A3E1NE77_9BACT|nr:hypothetical protein [Deminuibacter soli]RFM26131.1 hypothetical protein DXN05_21235 [Deminuibacter soli]
MKQKQPYRILITAVIALLCVTKVAVASFSGSSDDSKNKVSLKNLNKYSKVYNIPSLRTVSGFPFKSIQDFDNQGDKPETITLAPSSQEVTSFMRVERGNTTYVFPYKYKVKVPLAKFKTPSTPAFR